MISREFLGAATDGMVREGLFEAVAFPLTSEGQEGVSHVQNWGWGWGESLLGGRNPSATVLKWEWF